MAVPLNKIPPGLLDFLGIKSGAWGPRELGQVLQPELDLTRWYLDNNALEFGLTPTVAAFAASANFNALTIASTAPPIDASLLAAGVLTVPQTEAWLILEASFFWSFSAHAGSSVDFYWFVGSNIPNGGGFPLPMLSADVTASSATAQLAGVRTLERPIWIRPGQIITPNHSGVIVGAGGTVSLNSMRLRLNRFLI